VSSGVSLTNRTETKKKQQQMKSSQSLPAGHVMQFRERQQQLNKLIYYIYFFSSLFLWLRFLYVILFLLKSW
jgi:hypothetical protein